MRSDDLVLSGQLWTYLADPNEQAQNGLQLIIMYIREAESLNEELRFCLRHQFHCSIIGFF